MQRMLELWCVCSLLIMATVGGMAQGVSVTGYVVDENNLPLWGATVKVKDEGWGTITDVKGKFSLNNIKTTQLLVFSYLGKQTVETMAKDGIKVVLHQQSEELEEAVVPVAYGRLKKQAVTGAVASIHGKAIERRPVTSVTAALDGEIAGVFVNNTYGQPGDDPAISIRGFSSVNGVNTPLYVVDGVPFAGNFSELNPDDVESISVLKDAAAAALYGNRAANGVILVTLKQARTERLTMNFTVRQGIYARGIKEYECLGSDDFMEVMWKSYRNSLMTINPGLYPTLEAANAEASATLIPNVLGYNIYNLADDALFDAKGHLAEGATVLEPIREDLDWFAPLGRKGFRQEYSLNGGAGGEKSDYYFSLGYLNEEGFLKNAGFDRLTSRLQLNVLPRQWLKFGLSLSGNYQNQDITDGTQNSYVNAFNVSRYFAPIYPVHLHDLATGEYIPDEKGEKQYDNGVNGRKQYVGRNIVWENELNRNRQTKTTLMGGAFADLKLPLGFTFTLKGDLYLADQERKVYYNAEIGDGMGAGKTYRYQYRFKRYVFQEQLKWNGVLGKHQAEVLLDHENYYYNYQYTALAKSDQILPGNLALSNFTTLQNVIGYPQNYRTESFLGSLRYNYDEKYFTEIAFRRDGSSRYHPDHRWGNFGSVGIAWLASRENFLKNVRWLDYLKLRFSYGEVGNDASVDYYAWMSLYKIAVNGGEAAFYKSQNVAEDITWETLASYDAALETTLFGRWNIAVGYFDKRSDDLLFDVSLPLSAGATSTDASQMAKITRNLGSVSNRGWEISTDVDILHSKSWHWNVGVNATFLKNKILTLPAENRLNGIVVAGQNQKYMEGHSMYEWWLPCYAGVDRLTGNSLYLPDLDTYSIGDEQGDKQPLPEDDLVKIGDRYYTTNTSFAQKDWCGSALPKVYGGFSTQLDWKGISLSALFTYSVGGKVYDQPYASLMATASVPGAVHRDILKSWEKAPEGMQEDSPDRLDPEGIPVINADLSGRNNATSSRFLIDASYLWVKNITAAYAFPGSVARKLDVQSVRFNLSLENVALFARRKGMNPQQSFNGLNDDVLVAPRIISLGLTVKL